MSVSKRIVVLASAAIASLSMPCNVLSQAVRPDISIPIQIESSVIERTKAGVVQVFAANSAGSGFFVDIKGTVFVVTNAHVIESAIQRSSGRSNNVAPIRVRTAFNEEIRASVWKESRNHDIAVLKIERVPSSVVPLQILPALPAIGAEVFLWGAPRGIALVPLDGAVVATEFNEASDLFAGSRVQTIVLQISVAPGNSGGPLLDRRGRVIGVISARRESSERVSTGVSVAISAVEFERAIVSFNPRDADSLGFIGGALPIPAPRSQDPDLKARPADPVRPSEPRPKPIIPDESASLSDFQRGEVESGQYSCSQRLLLKPEAGRYGFPLNEPRIPRLIHFPLDTNRIQYSRMIGPQNVEIVVSASRDGGNTFVCVLPS